MIKELKQALLKLISTINRINITVARMEFGPVVLSRELSDDLTHYHEVIKASAMRLYHWVNAYAARNAVDEQFTTEEQHRVLGQVIFCERNASECGILLHNRFTISQYQYISEQMELTRERILNINMVEYYQRLNYNNDTHFDDVMYMRND